MPDLKVGFDYHLAEVRRAGPHSQVAGERLWIAFCPACGWIGRDTSKAGAEDDAAAHDNAENPS